ncbi:MAG TPA: hypothetical protein VHN80_23220 [Kineosporiaceae bacterium]|nr:hypothetical protein [Kineosporiaceae bacterium]
MSDLEAAFAVDPDELASLGRALDDATQVLATARRRLEDVRSGASEWAADGTLPLGLTRFLDAIDWAVDSARDGASCLVSDVGAAARGYRDAEDSARLRDVVPDRDANS